MHRHLKAKNRQRHTGHWLLAGSVVIAVEVFLVAFLLVAGGHATTGEPSMPHGAPFASWNENGRSGQYVLQVLEGSAPPAGATVSGVVTSDTTCQPDALGLSHCHNGIDLAKGVHITVINTHLMRRYRCLRPGETVSLTRINASWVLASVHSSSQRQGPDSWK